MIAAISAIRLLSGDAEALAGFYVQAFGFDRQLDGRAEDAFCGPLRRLAVLTLGDQRLEIAQPCQLAAATPAVSQPTTDFQHFALVAPDMERALARLAGQPGWTAITRSGPQTLPHPSGGVTAFKFRDPDGHPLELLTFPEANLPADWRGCSGDVAGIDHTAIIVSDTAESINFYGRLGFRQTGATLNRGPEQAALDGIHDPVVAVTALALRQAPPHLELLCYRQARPASRADDDPLATRTIIAGGDTALRDPDGHRWIVPASMFAAWHPSG